MSRMLQHFSHILHKILQNRETDLNSCETTKLGGESNTLIYSFPS